MIRKLHLVFLLLLACTYTGFAQHTCNLTLTPEGDNLCILEKRAYDFSMIRACRGNIVNYRANSPSAISYEWTVVGGDYQLFDNGSLCQVTWGEGYSGMVIVEAMLPDSSICTSQIQVVLEDKPVAGIISVPNYIVNVDDPEEKWIEVCLGDTLSFVDNSTSSDLPIIDYYWEFPYGVSNNRSISFVARDPGSYSIIHRVYNECGCYDEAKIKLIVREECPLKLSCFGTVCAYSQYSYSILSPGCTDYLWNVEGGTIVSPQHQPDVVVQWDAPESGFGMLYLDGASCECECKSRKSIKIPVISDNVNINGPDTICLDESYTFSVPLWGSTRYSWSVTPSTGIDVSEDNNNLILTPHQKRTYILSVTYSCDFLGCGPYTVTKVIDVRNKLNINADSSDEEVCIGTSLTFSTNTTAPSDWTVELNDSILHSNLGSTLSYTFNTNGIFVIKARNANYCNEALMTVIVKDNPPAPTMISGPDTICPGYTAEYSAIPSSQDNIIFWEWNTDGLIHTYAGNKVNITFGNSVENINVYQVDRETGCRSEAAVYHVSPFRLAAWPYQGYVRVCQGQTITLSSLRDQSEDDVLYEWKVEPAYALSIQGSHLAADLTILANYSNNLPLTARLILKRAYCDTSRYDTAYVRIGEIDPPTITHTPVCVGQSGSFSVADESDANKDASYWYIDNNTSNPEYGIPRNLVFDNTNSHVVHLHYVSKYGCDIDDSITITPCPAMADMQIISNNGTLSVVIDGGSTGYSYLWMTGETTSSIVHSDDNYWCKVTSSECGCIRKLSHHTEGSGCINVNAAFDIIPLCNNIIGINLHSIPGLNYPLSVSMSQRSYNKDYTVKNAGERLMVPDTGDFTLTVQWSMGDTCYYSTVHGAINNAIIMQYENNCNGQLVISGHQTNGVAIVIDATAINLSNSTISTHGLEVNRVSLSIPDSGWYRIHLIFNDDTSCWFDTLIHFNLAPSIQSINVGSTLCENTAFTFSADATGTDLTYKWEFGDGSWNFGNGIDHVYGYPEHSTVTLTVTDPNGCSSTYSTFVNVINNDLESFSQEGIVTNNSPTCPGDSVVIRTITGQSIYSWSPCDQFTGDSAYVFEAGTYIVDITSNIGGCRKQWERNVPYPNGPFASIVCDSTYCQGDIADIMGDIGNEYTYQWHIHSENIDDSATSSNLKYHLFNPGSYQVILQVSDLTGCSSFDTAYFYVHPTPSAPILQFCGNQCITAGPVDLCSASGLPLLWSNGTKGSSAQYFTDGSVGAYYIDVTTGCKSYGTTIQIPKAPNFDGLLTGCYCIDSNALPANLPLYSLGSSNTLPWKWDLFYSAIISGNIPPSPIMLPVPSVGEYNLVIPDYGLGCHTASPSLLIETQGCKNQITPNETSSVWGVVTKKICELIGCELQYVITVRICNGTNEPVCIDNISPILPINYSVTSGIPMMLNPTECQDVTLVMQYNFSSPSSFVYDMTCGGESVGNFTVDLSDWMDCVQPDTCVINVTPSFVLDQTLSQPYQSVFFNIGLTFPTLSGTVISVWCDQGQIIDGNYVAPTYSGLLMLDYGLMTQLVVDSADFCFHVVCCDDGRICTSDICIPYRDVWEMCGQLNFQSGSKKGNVIENNRDNNTETKFLLVPNPATKLVRVMQMDNRPMGDEIQLVEVFSMNGQKVISREFSDQFDISCLPSGTYIVKVVTSMNSYDYLKLIKQ
jgi:hypothetical protein